MIVCEGYMDVIALHQAGFLNAVASLGTALTMQHASILKRYTDEVVLSYDSDDAGVRAALRAIPLLRNAGLRAKVLDLAPYKDPDEFIKARGKDAFEERVENAQGSFFFEVSCIERSYDMKDPESKTAFFRAVAEKIASFESQVEREACIEAVAERYHVSFDGMRAMVSNELLKGSGLNERPARREQTVKSPDGTLRSQRLLLSWLCEYPGFYAVLKQYLKPEDFSEGLYRDMARAVYAQAEAGEIRPASLLSGYAGTEEEKAAASLLTNSFPG